MIIDRDIDKFILSSSASIASALEALNANKHQILFIVDGHGHLVGSFTDGDFRRWVLNQTSVDITHKITQVMNPECVMFFEEQGLEILEANVNEHIKCIPVLDNFSRVTGIARRQSTVITIDNHTISKSSPSFIIAEIGNNHNGSLANARKLVDAAIAAGADCVKFQMRDLASLYVNQGNNEDASEDLGSQYILELLNKFQLSDDEFAAIFRYCKEKKITVLCTPFDIVSANKLAALEIPAFKVASADLTNHPLLVHLCSLGKPLIVSTGMATDDEIEESVALLNRHGAKFVLLHCNSTYPAPFKDINLRYLDKLGHLNQGLVGYSGHERDINVALGAVALGAKVIEKHFTLDRTLEGNDHKVSLLPSEFANMVEGIRQIEAALGNKERRKLSQGEMMNREVLAKSLYASVDIPANTKIIEAMISVKSPGKGLSPNKMSSLVGRVINRSLKAGEAFYPSDLTNQKTTKKKQFALPGKFGIPIRYHDVHLASDAALNMVEFHLSFKDLDLSPGSYLKMRQKQLAVVHAPELFASDHTLDLASSNEAYWQASIDWLNQVLDIAREIKTFYPATTKIPVVVNAGGFSQDNFVSEQVREGMYKRVGEALSHLNLHDIDLLIQTMPPFPWHFGGQRYHNLFVRPDETQRFCDTFDVNVCLDVSHSWLACNYLEFDIASFFTSLHTRIHHLHIADAKGVDDEGLQIGDGDLPVERVFTLYQAHCPDATWLPEIWQGHKNEGEGFWLAFAKLEGLLGRPTHASAFATDTKGSHQVLK